MLRTGLCIGKVVTIAAVVMPAIAVEADHGKGIRVLYWGASIGAPQYAERLRQALDLDYISGLDLYVPWLLFEPQEGDYQWPLFDTPFKAAAERGKTVGIGLLTASKSPEWLIKRSAAFAFTHPHPAVGRVVSPVPWDTTYRDALVRTVAALAKRYDGHKKVAYVVINGPSTLYGVETNWPMKRKCMSADDVARLGYTLPKFIAGWKNMVDVFLEHFEKSTLSLALNHEAGANEDSAKAKLAAAREIRDYALRRYASERGRSPMLLQLLGLTHGNSKYFAGPYTGKQPANAYISLVWDVRKQVRIGYECAQIWRYPNVHNRTGYDATYVRHVLENGISWGGEFVKIKLPDVISPEDGMPYLPYVSVLKEASLKFGNLRQSRKKKSLSHTKPLPKEIDNTGAEPLVGLRYLGPDVHAAVPNVSDYRK